MSKSNRRNQRFRLFLRQKGECALCGTPMELQTNTPLSVSLDHIVRKRDGGLGTLSNLRATHICCNTWRN